MAVKKLVSIAIAAIAGQLIAGTYTWTGAAGDDLFFTAGNWSYDDGAGNVTSPATTAPARNTTDDIVISGAKVAVSYVPGNDFEPKGTVTISNGASFTQQEKTSYMKIHGKLVIDGGTFDTGTTGAIWLDGDVVVSNGGVFTVRKAPANQSGFARIVLSEGGTMYHVVDGAWLSRERPQLVLEGGTAFIGYEKGTKNFIPDGNDDFRSGKIVLGGQLQPPQTFELSGNVTFECGKFAPQTAGSVETFRAGRLVATNSSDNGFWQNNGNSANGTYIDVPAGSTAVFTLNIAADNAYSATFGSNATKPKFRYGGAIISESDFNTLFMVEDSVEYDGLVDIYLKPTSTDAPSFVGSAVTASLVSSREATLSAEVERAGTPAANLVALWGFTDGGYDFSNWDNVLDLGTATDGGEVTASLTLVPNRRYYYRLAATNEVGMAWAAPSPAYFVSAEIPGSPTNTWIGAVSSDSREPGNWSLNHVPTASETVFVLDLLAQNQLDWWPGTGADTVAGWLQPEDGFEDAKWAVTFHMTPDNALSVAGDVLLGAGRWTHDGPTATPTCAVNVAVAGDFTICNNAEIVAGSGANLDATGIARGYYNAGPGYTAGLAGASYAGDGGSTSVVSFVSYGSVINPLDYGSSGLGNNDGFSGAGLIMLCTGGRMTVDGYILAIGHGWNAETGKGASTGGSINITAGELLGTGSISANGGQDTAVGSGSGGRIAVRLTGSGADFSNAPTMTANGRGGSASGATSSAAGTIYLQTASDQEGCGTVRVSNPNNLATLQDEAIPPAATHLPAKQDGDSMPALKKTKWELSGRGAIRLTRDVQIASLSLAADDGTQTVYTDGFKLTTPALNVNGFNLRGVYTKDNAAWVKGEGSVTVGGSGLVVFIR